MQHFDTNIMLVSNDGKISTYAVRCVDSAADTYDANLPTLNWR